MSEQSNVDRLHDAGVLDKTAISEGEKTAVNTLSEGEVTALISMREKLQTAGVTDPKIHGSANCF